MLNKEQKKEVVKRIKDKLKENNFVVFCNFEGLSVGKQRELKKQFKSQEGELFVVKKKLFQKALSEEGLEVPEIKGSLVVGVAKDEVFPAKIIANFPKSKKEILEFVGGVLNEKGKYIFLSKEEVTEIAKLPSKEELIAKLIGTIKSPLSNLNFVLKENLRKLTYILANISE